MDEELPPSDDIPAEEWATWGYVKYVGSSASPVLTSIGSHLSENALAKELEARPPVRRALDHFQPINVPFRDPIAEGVFQRCPDAPLLTLKPLGKGFQLPNAACLAGLYPRAQCLGCSVTNQHSKPTGQQASSLQLRQHAQPSAFLQRLLVQLVREVEQQPDQTPRRWQGLTSLLRHGVIGWRHKRLHHPSRPPPV
jgi:hypothetical protein